MKWEEMRTFARDQIPNYMTGGVVDRKRLAQDVKKNYGLSQDMALKLVDSLNVDSRRPRKKA